MDLYEKITELGTMGYHCSQMIMIMTLETIGEENPQLVKALGGLGGGIGYCGDTCGCLTGGACAIGYFLGNLAPKEKEDEQMKPAVQELSLIHILGNYLLCRSSDRSGYRSGRSICNLYVHYLPSGSCCQYRDR